MRRHLIGARILFRVLLLGLSLVGAFLGGTSQAAAQTDDGENQEEQEETDSSGAHSETDSELDVLLAQGSAVYSQICSACHQPGGVGLPGQFPPLIDNPNLADADYIAEVIADGRQGEISVGGVTYDGVMPSFSTLSDDDTEAVIAFIQNDFAEPQAAQDAFAEAAAAPSVASDLPFLANAGSWIAYMLPVLVGVLVMVPRLLAKSDRLSSSWVDAWFKAAAIVIGMVFLTVYLPDKVLRSSTVAGMGGFTQDLIGSGIWAVGLGIVLGVLWWAHKESRI